MSAPHTAPKQLGFEERDFKVKIVVDGTRTIVEVYDLGRDPAAGPIGVGYAVRRKGDRRKPYLGSALAAARAFQSVADSYSQLVKRIDEGSYRP
ncbi:hypothetical protein [Streptomyces sp. S1]|uniref:hypothetical protein n=1 Tax=Streptomyces sp. S1 TaxID=718288 RepID=UPI003D73E70F